MLTIDEHPLFDGIAFVTEYPVSLDTLEYDLTSWFSVDAVAPLSTNDEVKKTVRDLLRHGGYKPTGRGKPASEYLIKAVTKEMLSPINAAVDACNAVSLHSGLPISVVDLAKAKEPFRIGIAPAETSYVFNATGQAIKLDGLLCLFDVDGACANAVKDCQRTKTDAETRRTLSVIWGTNQLAGRTQSTFEWYRDLLRGLGASVEQVRHE